MVKKGAFPEDLSRREREVLGIVFRLERATVNQVMDEMPEPPTRAALRSILRILEEKGHLAHHKAGREFVYRSTEKKHRAGKQALSGVLQTFFDGSLGKAVAAHLADPSERIDAAEAAELEELIAKLSERAKRLYEPEKATTIMKAKFASLLEPIAATEHGLRLLDVGLKLTLLLAALLLASAVMHRVFNRSAAQRASLVLIGSLAIPLVALSPFQNSDSQEPLWEVAVGAPVGLAWIPATSAAATNESPADFASPRWPEPAAAAQDLRPAPPSRDAPSASAGSAVVPPQLAWDRWMFTAWLGGILLVAASLALGLMVLRFRTRHFTCAAERGRLRATLRVVCRETGLRRIPTLLVDDHDATMPMTWGALHHRILLPKTAAVWSDERLYFVLRHEVGHVRRRDCLAGWVMRLLLAPAWFHPLAWLLHRHATDLRERACDDLSTRSDEEIGCYARELVAISRATGHSFSGGLAMARPKRLEGRIRALYCERLARGSAGACSRAMAATLFVSLVLPALVFTIFQSVPLLRAAPPEGEDTAYLRPDRQVEMRMLSVFHSENVWQGSETRELEAIDRVVQGWVEKLPAVRPEKAFAAKESDLILLGKKGRVMGLDYPGPAPAGLTGIPRFQEGKMNKGYIAGMPAAAGVFGHVRDVKVTYLATEPGKISVSFAVDLFESGEGSAQREPQRSIAVGPMIIDNGGGVVLGVSGEGKVEQFETAIHKLPILRGIAKRQREKLQRYKTIEVLAFKVVEDWNRQVTSSVSPKPVFKKGSQRVELRAFEFTDGLQDDGQAAVLSPAEELIGDWAIGTAAPVGKQREASAAELSLLEKAPGVDSFALPEFTTGKRYTCKVIQKFATPDSEALEIGLVAAVKVTPLANGKLSVEIEPSITSLSTMTPDEITTARRTGLAPAPQPLVSRGLTSTHIIENGGGIVLGIYREDIQQVSDSVPVLGKLPLLHHLFSSEYENHYKRMMALRITVPE